ncbi:MAG TPA: hypothetical protein VN701_02245 [Candidatus Paceibacterota bacterium]|nr:hypothetical protein [Candidatus Paceibacterota bacterium]
MNKNLFLVFIIISLLVGLAGGYGLHGYQYKKDSNQNFSTATSSQDFSGLQFTNCLAQADTEYDQKWNSLCQQEGEADYCQAFVGSPKDIQLTQIRNQEKIQCATLYK